MPSTTWMTTYNDIPHVTWPSPDLVALLMKITIFIEIIYHLGLYTCTSVEGVNRIVIWTIRLHSRPCNQYGGIQQSFAHVHALDWLITYYDVCHHDIITTRVSCLILALTFVFLLICSRLGHGFQACSFPLNLAGRLMDYHNIHTTRHFQTTVENVAENNSANEVSSSSNDAPKLKRKKLKGKRAVVKWLKLFRWKKKKEYERMTSEEKILFKLKKARKKEERLVEALKKIEPKDSSVVTHDPEVLTPEEHFYLLKLGRKLKNYVPIGRRGIFQGVILNMHLHWKKHQTLQVIVKTFTSEEVREIAVELARLTGGIVLDIDKDNTITMYRGKNYSQPPTEIMSPKVTLSRKKALDKSKYRDAIHAVRKFIPKLEQDLEDLCAGTKRENESAPKLPRREENPVTDQMGFGRGEDQMGTLKQSESESRISGEEYESSGDSSGTISESENLSDIFETDSDAAAEEQNAPPPLYLDEIERFPSGDDGDPEDFQEHLRRISAAARRGGFGGDKDLNIAELDDIDKIFLRADSLLKKKKI